jgi:hypothetical protein
MEVRRRAIALLATAVLAGCAANVATSSSPPLNLGPDATRFVVLNLSGTPSAMRSNGWPNLGDEWQKAIGEAGDAAGIRTSYREGEPRPTGEPGTLVDVFVNSFRHVAPGTRFVVGVMAGNAHLNVKVRFLDLKTGAVIGERTYNTTSRGGEGIFSAMTDRQVRAIASEIVGEIKR